MDSRSALLTQLKTYRPLNAIDRTQVTKIMSFVSEHPRCFDRTHVTGHITGSAWVVDAAGGRVLLTHHKALNKWLQLGGHADGESDVLAVAKREAEEESGLKSLKTLTDKIFDVDIHRIPHRKKEPEHFHYDIRYLFQADSSEPLLITKESKNLAWVPLDDLERYSTERSVLRMREKWRLVRPK